MALLGVGVAVLDCSTDVDVDAIGGLVEIVAWSIGKMVLAFLSGRLVRLARAQDA